MFGAEAEKFALPVVLTLASGERLSGNLLLARAQKLSEALNRPDAFIEFRGRDGMTSVIAKSAIAQASLLDLPRTDQLARGNGFDPYRALGLEAGASAADIRAAYLAKARMYHADQYANQALPPEVTEYLNATFAHIRAAYEELAPREKKPAAASA